MVTVGMIYNPLPPRADLPADRPRPPRPAAVSEARYLAGFYDLEGIGAQLRRQADAVGLWQAECVIALTDGGNGLEPMLRRDFDGGGIDPRLLACLRAPQRVGQVVRRGDDRDGGRADPSMVPPDEA